MKLNLQKFIGLNRWITFLFVASMIGFTLLPGVLPKVLVVLCIGCWVAVTILGVVLAVTSVMGILHITCPKCGLVGRFSERKGFICDDCGIVKCRGWLSVRYEVAAQPGKVGNHK